MKMLGLNTVCGNADVGENGLAALPDRVEEARRAIDQAVDYATDIDAANIHVMAGKAAGADAHATFVSNLRYAAEKAAKKQRTILIEPLNKYAAPGYFLNTTDQARQIIEEVGADNVKLMFDCFHVQMSEGDLSNKLQQLLPLIGHIQFAAAPDRGEPDHGEINYYHVFKRIEELGYMAPLGAEYRPTGDTDASLGWMKTLI